MQDARKELTRLKGVLTKSAKTDKLLAAECKKKEDEHAALQGELEVLLERVDNAGERREELKADFDQKEAAAAEANEAFDALHEQACLK